MAERIEVVGHTVYRHTEGHYTKIDNLEVFNNSVYHRTASEPCKEVGHGLTDAATEAIVRLMSLASTEGK